VRGPFEGVNGSQGPESRCTHHEPRLFTNLLKLFFLVESLPAASPSGKLTPSSGNEVEVLKTAEEEFERREFLTLETCAMTLLGFFFLMISKLHIV